MVFSECSFSNTLLPWDNLYLLNCVDKIRKLNSIESQLTVLPAEVEFYAMAVRFEDLNKIRSTVGVCEGFDLTEFDEVILVSLCFGVS